MLCQSAGREPLQRWEMDIRRTHGASQIPRPRLPGHILRTATSPEPWTRHLVVYLSVLRSR